MNENNASVLNGVTFGAGRVGQAFAFDGNDDRVQLADVEALKLTNSLTIEAWIFLDAFPLLTENYGLSLIVFRGDDQDNLDPYYLGVDWQGQAWFHIANSSRREANLFAPVPTHRFFHLAATLDHATGSMRLYVDGVQAAQTTTDVRPFRDLNPNANPGVGIGNHPGYPNSPYNFPLKGKVDELSIYNRALSPGEVAALFNADTTGKCRAVSFAATQPATLIRGTNATLNGMATPNGLPSTAWFEWGTNASYGQVTSPMAVGSGNEVVRVEAGISNLIPSRVYHARLVVSNATGIARGADQPFITGGRVLPWGGNYSAQTTLGLSNAVGVAAYSGHSLALRTDGTVVTWDNNCCDLVNVSNVAAIATGASHSLALRPDGTVLAWGYNHAGQTNVPADLSNVVAVACGNSHSLALRAGGTVVGWGNNYYGQTNVPAGLSNVVAIAGSGSHSLALRNDGTVVAWGSSTYGQTTVPAGLSNVVAIAGGEYHSLALRRDGTVVAWGHNTRTNVPAGLNNVVAIAGGDSHSLALSRDGTVVAWGFFTTVPAGLGSVAGIAAGSQSLALAPNQAPLIRPKSVAGVMNTDLVITLSATDLNYDTLNFRIAALPGVGKLCQYAGGGRGAEILAANTPVNDAARRVIFAPVTGGFGNPYTSFSFVANDGMADSVPAIVTIIVGLPSAATQPPNRITEVSATLNGMATPNSFQSVAWFEWGTNVNYGHVTSPWTIGAGSSVVPLGVGISNLIPRQVYHYRLVTSNALGVVWGADQIFKTGGQVLAWGYNDDGQTAVPMGLSNAVGVAAGGRHSMALRTDGTVVAWGWAPLTNVPAGLEGVLAIAGGGSHSLALRSDGTVIAWGDNSFGQSAIPAGLGDIVAIAGGGSHSLALRNNGTVIGWGDNSLGQANAPAGLSNVVGIACGTNHSLALRSDGIVVAWGDNSAGQTNIPAGLNNVIAISGSGRQCLALRDDGKVVAWGNNQFGPSTAPEGLSNVVAIAAGHGGGLAIRRDGSISNLFESGVPTFFHNAITIAASHQHSLVIGSSYDDFDGRLPMAGTNIFFTTDTRGSTSESMEPRHSLLVASSNSIWLTWTAPFSGGVIIGGESCCFEFPALAVYTGNSLGSLTQVVNNASGFYQSRVVFNAVANMTYQIAVVDNSNSPYFTLRLRLSSPPANDDFANRVAIPGLYFESKGSFIGATSEPDEPNHGETTYEQTVWWTWTAPTDLGVNDLPVSLMADAVSFPPDIAVYLGTSVSNLISVDLATRTNGMTRISSFAAAAGTTYQIALGGLHYDPAGNNFSPRFGSYRLRLNCRALVLSIENLDSTNNCSSCPVAFGADAQVTHYGSGASAPLRIVVNAIAGIGLRGSDGGYVEDDQILLMTTNLPALSPGQSVVARINGTVPAPTNTYEGVGRAGVGYGAYAELQEEVAPDVWFPVDPTLVLFGNWPRLGDFPGPGGGVIRLDPDAIGLSTYYSLDGVQILGPSRVVEGGVAQYVGRAAYLKVAPPQSTTNYDFTGSIWRSSRFHITNGLFTAGSVTSDTPARLAVEYSSHGWGKTGFTEVVVSDLPPPVLGLQRQPSTFDLTINGVPGRRHAVETIGSLSPPVLWIPLHTNFLGTNGLWNLAITNNTNERQRFFRARELE